MSGDKIRRVDFSPDEWLVGTGELTNDERGLFITACALVYSTGGGITQSRLRDACRLEHGRAFNRQLARLLTLGKLIEKEGKITNKRSENELETARKRVENGRKNVAKRWNNNGVDPDLLLQGANANHQPSTTNYHTPPKPPSRGARKRNGADPWPQLADLTRAQLAARINHIKGHEHYLERQEIKRRLGYIVPPD